MGKTQLASAFSRILDDSVMVKLGTHEPRPGKTGVFFWRGTRFSDVLKRVGDCSFLIIESGEILDDPEMHADLVLFLPAGEGRSDKPGSVRRRQRADLIRGQVIEPGRANDLRTRLDLDEGTFFAMLEAAGISVTRS